MQLQNRFKFVLLVVVALGCMMRVNTLSNRLLFNADGLSDSELFLTYAASMLACLLLSIKYMQYRHLYAVKAGLLQQFSALISLVGIFFGMFILLSIVSTFLSALLYSWI